MQNLNKRRQFHEKKFFEQNYIDILLENWKILVLIHKEKSVKLNSFHFDEFLGSYFENFSEPLWRGSFVRYSRDHQCMTVQFLHHYLRPKMFMFITLARFGLILPFPVFGFYVKNHAKILVSRSMHCCCCCSLFCGLWDVGCIIKFSKLVHYYYLFLFMFEIWSLVIVCILSSTCF